MTGFLIGTTHDGVLHIDTYMFKKTDGGLSIEVYENGNLKMYKVIK